jgi:hypothetical protein
MEKVRAFALALFSLALFTQFSAAQANINEGLETQSFYVSPTGSNSNPGTQSQPFQTIGYAASQAVTNNYAGLGTHIWIENGTYRETVNMNGATQETSLPITFEAVNHGQVTISGGVLYTGWSVYSGNSNIYTNAWNNTWGVCATVTGCSTSTYPQPNIMLRQEMVAVNGTPLTEVLSLTQMVEGTFYVNTTSKLIYVWPPTGTNMSTATVDVATEPSLFNIAGWSNIVVRGIVFQYANSCRSNAAVNVTGGTTFAPTNIEFDSDTFQWNNGQGLALNNPITYFTVENSSSIHNGDSGFQGYNTEFGLYSNDLTGYNNWRGAQGAYYLCNVGGFHSWEAHTDQLTGYTAQYNQSYGIHWDTDNVSITGSDVIASENLVPGMFAEKDPGPIALTGSYVCNQTNANSPGGFTIRNSEGVSFTNGVLYNNNASQWAVTGTAGGIEITDWLTGQEYNLITQGMVNTGNVIEGVGAGQILFNDGQLNGSDWTTFLLGFNSNQNTWWNASGTNEWIVPVPALSTVENLAGWQGTTLQDLDSTFAAPSGSPQTACNVTADASDFWVTANSPSVTSNPAGQTIFDLTITPLSTFAGTVNFTLDGISEVKGLSATNPVSVTGSGTTTLTVNNTTATTVGTYPVTVIANSGSQTHTVTVNVVIPTSQVRLNTVSLTFASQQTGTTSAPMNVTMQNYGKTALSITSIKTTTDFAVSSNTCGTSLAAGASCIISVTFTPNAVGTITGTLTITDGDPTSPQLVSLTGSGTGSPAVTLSPGSLSFGQVLVKTASTPQNVTVTNTGQGTLTFTGGNAAGIKITGADVSSYSQTNNCGTSLAAGASCTITVTFTPQTTGSLTGDVTLTDNATSKTQTVSLSGTGAYPTVKLTPSTLAFGSIAVGSSSSPMTSTLTNNGQVSLTITKVALSGANPGEYTETNTCIGTFAPNATCTITATFSPTKSGAQNASITITDNTSTGSSTLTLTGTGAQPTATLTPSTYNYGTINEGSNKSETFTLKNTSTSSYTLDITSTTITGTNKADFIITANTCSTTLAKGATCTITVEFKPSTAGAESATLSVADNTAAGSTTAALSGTGNAVTFTPATHNYGTIKVGTSKAQVYTLANISSPAFTVTITSIAVSGTNAADFVITTNTCGSTLAQGASCAVTVTFTPSIVGAESATLTVTDNSGTGTITSAMSGTGD